MTLRNRTLLVVGLTLAALIAVLYSIAAQFLLSGLAAVEDKEARENVRRATNALDALWKEINTTAVAWSQWDDSLKFIQGKDAAYNRTYTETNFNYGALSATNCNILVMIERSGGIVYATGLDYKAEKTVALPDGVRAYLKPGSALLRHQGPQDGNNGLLLLPNHPLLVAARPITTTAGKGAVGGTMLFGRYLDKDAVMRLSEMTRQPIAVQRFDQADLPADFQVARGGLGAETPIIIRPLGNNSMAGYTTVRDINDRPALLLRASMPRDIYFYGQSSVRYLFFSLLTVGLTFISLSLLLLERSILAPLSQLSRDVDRIRTSGDLAVRVTSGKGKDELATLSANINEMLQSLQSAHDTKKMLLALQESQQQLMENQERLRALVNSIDEIVFEFDRHGTYLDIWTNREELLARPRQELLGHSVDDFFDETMARTFKESFARVADTGQAEDVEYALQVDNREHWFLGRVTPISSSRGASAVCLLARDISERKRVEEQTRTSLREKEVLLKEIHHRVKNNLQIISSMLNMQSDFILDENARSLFQETQNRVKAMALIHERLYRSDDLSGVEFSDYLENLAHSLLRTYGRHASDITLHLDTDEVHLNIDAAVPCGLVVNELISNALKHAFPDGRTGSIDISLHSQPATDGAADSRRVCVLQVSDNGIGLPANVDFRNTESIGLQLVTGLTEQLDGTIELQREAGTNWTMTFKINA